MNEKRPYSCLDRKIWHLRRVAKTYRQLAQAYRDEATYHQAIIDNITKRFGLTSLADVVPISYADKGEIKKLIARLKKSTAETELKARGEELQNIISQYEDRANDTESDDLQEEFQSIVEALENGQQELEGGDKDSAINKIEESLFQ